MTEDAKGKFEHYVTFGNTDEEKKDLAVLASVAIAGFSIFVTVDYTLLGNKCIEDFVRQQDNIFMYRPSEIIKQLEHCY